MKRLENSVAATLVVLLLACAGCASNPNVGGEIVSGILMGIGTGLSGLWEAAVMDCDEEDYEKMSQDQLLALVANDQLAAEEFYYRYHYSNDPVLEAEASKVLKLLAEEYEATSFWLDWYVEKSEIGVPIHDNIRHRLY